MSNQNERTVFEPTTIADTTITNEGTVFGTIDHPDLLSRTKKKIAGILFSFSRDNYGEFWVVYQGRNTIGSGSGSSIRLLEKSVSEKHALILARVIDGPQLIFELRDEGSNGGTILNDHDLFHYKNYATLKHGDIIKVGGYELLFYAVDDLALGLKPNPGFMKMEEIPSY